MKGKIMKKVISVTLNENGTIKGLLFEGNKRPTPVSTVIKMLEKKSEVDFGETGIQVVTKADGSKYLRSTPNDTLEDNFGFMAEEVKAEEEKKEQVWEEIQEVEARSPGILAKIREFLFGIK